MWENMIAIVTKVGWNEDHEEMQDWIDEMETYKKELGELLQAKYKQKIDNPLTQASKESSTGSKPTIFAISQDMTKPRREENKPGTEQNALMLEQMELVYIRAYQKFKESNHLDLS